jgi:polyphosphate kinase
MRPVSRHPQCRHERQRRPGRGPARPSRGLIATLAGALGLRPDGIYRIRGPLDLSAFFGFASMPGGDDLKEEAWPPVPSPHVRDGETIFEAIRRRDLLLFTPYESFEPVVRLVEEAADDPHVLAIKQILYRTSGEIPIVAALARAAERGKQVTALVELKARFDEARNIDWARALERAGVQVIYGIRRLKTHAKICLIVRRESDGIRRYLHLGTGNYNERTARLYSDISLMTCHEDFGRDGSAFFNAITGYSQPLPYRRLEAAPLGLRLRLIELIRGETQRAAQGQKARILAKVNSLADPAVIEALYDASRAGVKIDLSVRGICCLRPGVPGLSETIRVVSVVDRFLEHARIFYFHHGGNAQVLISSADWMPRNLDKRIELLVPVLDPAARRRLVGILKTCVADNVKGRTLRPDGGYERPTPPARGRRIRSQATFYDDARRAAQVEAETRKAIFEPHRPPSDQASG